MNNENLIPNSERSTEELRKMGRRGGIKSGESRRKTRDQGRMVKRWLEVFNELESKDKARAKQVYEELMKGIM